MLSCGHNQINHQDVRTGRHRLCHTAGLVTPFLFFTMKTTIVKLRISEADKARWQANADAEGKTLSAYVRDMVEVGQAETERIDALCRQMEGEYVRKLAR